MAINNVVLIENSSAKSCDVNANLSFNARVFLSAISSKASFDVQRLSLELDSGFLQPCSPIRDASSYAAVVGINRESLVASSNL